MAKIDEDALWRKISKFAEKAGEKVVYNVLVLHYTLVASETPARAKAIILGALAYFISPIDAVPDFLPGGFADDAVTIVAALATIALHITEEIKAKAQEQMKIWFGDSTEK